MYEKLRADPILYGKRMDLTRDHTAARWPVYTLSRFAGCDHCLGHAHEWLLADKHDFAEAMHNVKNWSQKWFDLELDAEAESALNERHTMEKWVMPYRSARTIAAFSSSGGYPARLDAVGHLAPGSQSATTADFELCKAAFKQFAENNHSNPKYADKYAVFVHGNLYDVGDTTTELIKKVHETFGNVDMYVGNVSEGTQTALIESPELL